MSEVDYKAVLARKLGSMFPDPGTRSVVEEELNRYGTESYEKDPWRVRLDVLKIAGTSVDKIKEWVGIAKNDSRDVMAAAEYPEELVKPTWNFPASEQKAVLNRDKNQYLKWIEK